MKKAQESVARTSKDNGGGVSRRNLLAGTALGSAGLVVAAACGSSHGAVTGARDMVIEANRQQMSRFVEFINTASEQLAHELIAPDATFYAPGSPEPMRGPKGYLTIIAMMRSGFPDVQWTLEETVAEGDKLAARFTMRGTHRGTFFGVPPTGKPISIQAMNLYRFSGGKIVEEYGQPDLMGLMMQIGALPPPR